MLKVSKNEAVKYSRKGLDGLYYQLPEVNNGMTIANAKFTGEHGQRTIGENQRIYYVLKGEATFLVNGETFAVGEGDLVVIPPLGTYNSKGESVDILLIMELLDLEKLPK